MVIDTPALRKARGAFFTPPEITRFLASWAVRRAEDIIIEPSCGEAAFLLSAALQLRDLGRQGSLADQLRGIEIHEVSAATALDRLSVGGFSAEIVARDFFDVPATPKYDAVIGNPPFVRYQHFSGQNRSKALLAALAQGVRLSGLASSWAAFTVHAAQFLNPTGRLGLVLPAELLTVNYAARVRRFLLQRFNTVRLVMFEDRVFPGVLEEVVLLLAEGSGGAASFEVFQARDLNDLNRVETAPWTDFSPDGGAKWTPALLPSAAFDTYRDLTAGVGFDTLLDWGETYLGAVTGNNNYFTLTKAKADELDLPLNELVPISPPGSKHLRGLTFSARAWERLARDGGRCFLFSPSAANLSKATRRYIEAGEKAGVHKAYKCRVRTPWWRVPLVSKPDLLFTYMNHDRPRLTSNGASVHLLNSLYGVLLKSDRQTLGRELLPLACLNSATILGAEMVGRAYGGGMLKHEPKEADLLPVPSHTTLRATGAALRNLQPQMAGLLRKNDIISAVEVVDRVILQDYLGLDAEQVASLRRARDVLFQRRVARSRGQRGSD